MLTLNNFEKEVPKKLLERGRQYHENGAVTSLEEISDNEWDAEVEGSETYSIDVQLQKNGGIKEYFCDCPFDGEICKHVVAVLLAIREELEKPQGKEAKVSSKIAFGNLLQKITLAEYRDFIQQYASQYKAFKTEFEIYFADKDEQIDVSRNYEKLIKKSIQNHSDGGFVDYGDSISLSHDIGKILDLGFNFIKKNNYRNAFAVAKPVLKLMIETIVYSDDSEGSIGQLIEEAGQLIESIAESKETAIELKEQVYTFLQAELSNKAYFGYGDFGYNLFDILRKLAAQLNRQAEFIPFIDKLAAMYNGEYEYHTREFFQKEKIAFYEATGNKVQAQKLVEENINIVEVRAGLVNKAIAKKDFVTAKKLITDGIEVAEGNRHPGTVTDWEKTLVKIAVLEKDTLTIRHYTKKLAIDNGFNADYYNKWKKTYTANEWPEVIENHIRETTASVISEHKNDKYRIGRSRNPPLLEALAPVYIEEKYWDRMLALAKKETQLNRVWRYHSHLSKAYPDELIEIYIPLLAGAADATGDRGSYAELVLKMKKVIKDIPAGKEKITALARSLQLKYPRRPAMVQELSRVLK